MSSTDKILVSHISATLHGRASDHPRGHAQALGRAQALVGLGDRAFRKQKEQDSLETQRTLFPRTSQLSAGSVNWSPDIIIAPAFNAAPFLKTMEFL